MSIDTLGLREQKKRETRQAISDHATQLFLQRGFDRTTIADIAAAARVAKMTVTNYFPRKEDLALDHHAEFVAGLARTVAHRQAGESALGAVRRAYLAALERRDPVIGFTGRDFARMVADSPTLVARLRDLHDQREEALARQLAAEVPGDPVMARAVAAQLAAADRLLFRDLQARMMAPEDTGDTADATGEHERGAAGDHGRGTADGTADDLAAAQADLARRVFGLLEPAIGGYAGN